MCTASRHTQGQIRQLCVLLILLVALTVSRQKTRPPQRELEQHFSRIFTSLLLTRSAQMAHWDLAAVLVALAALLFTDTGGKVILSILRLRKWIWPDHARCELLSWNDIPDGRLHDCSGYCYHWSVHSRRQDCWESTLSLIFNRAWVLRSHRPKFAKKPEQLAFGRRFLRTDVETVLAFILSTVGERKSSEWDTSRLRFGGTAVSFEECHGVLVLHLRGNFRTERVNLTKHEVQMMLQGYPPFYREVVTLKHGPYVPHPIRDERDIERGGWIIAAGFSDNTLPLALYTLPNQAEDSNDSYIYRQNAIPFRNAVKRVLAVLTDIILVKFPEDQVRDVIKAVDHMVVNGTGSGVPIFSRSSGVPGGSFHQLTGQQCALAMKIFNDFRPLTMEQENQLRPVLSQVLNAAFRGSYDVIQYLKDTGRQLVLPKLLKDYRHDPIYLRDCEYDDK